MSNCCAWNSELTCALPQSKPGFCPVCGAQGKYVAMLTVKSLVRDHTRVPARSSFLFCRTATCDVVYFSGEAIFRKPEMKVRVDIKETEDPVPLCYCFDYTQEDILREIHETGETKLAEIIKVEVIPRNLASKHPRWDVHKHLPGIQGRPRIPARAGRQPKTTTEEQLERGRRTASLEDQ